MLFFLLYRKLLHNSLYNKKHSVQDAHLRVRKLSLCERVRRGECAGDTNECKWKIGGVAMRKQKDIRKMNEELLEIEGNMTQLVNGNLDITLNQDNFNVLSELAGDMNLISESFNCYINEISHVLSHLSSGNMAVSFTKEINYQGDFLPIKNALYKIRQSLNQSFEEINQLSDQVDQLCCQVENGSNQIANSAEEQAELIMNLSDTICQITEQTTENTGHIRQVADRVHDIKIESETGSESMKRMLDSIRNVQNSSQDISGIINIISDMAEQSKLLALNAAIEAARAGEAGKGFSVVAKEVAALAEKSANAVKQTTDLIQSSITKADESVTIADKTAKSFISIQKSIDSVSNICSDVAMVSAVQSNKLKETSQIITDISGTVQSNAAYAQENRAAMSNLAGYTSDLKKVMKKYRLKGQAPAIVRKNNLEKDYLNTLFQKLKLALEISEIDIVLEDIIKQQTDFECLYVIDNQGYQTSHTIMNPKLSVEQDENFKPALPGDYHGSKRYFRQAVKTTNEWYSSYEYISTATGELCKTLSCSYQGRDKQLYVICVDLICRF